MSDVKYVESLGACFALISVLEMEANVCEDNKGKEIE